MPRSESADPFLVSVSTPGVHFPDVFVLGNGRLGASSYGRAGTELVHLNVDSLWSGGPLAARPSRSASIAPLRAAVAADDHAEADRLARELQSDGWSQSYQPLGNLTWTWTDDARPEDGEYSRELDLRHGETRVRVDGHTLTSFVSAVDDVLVMISDGDGDHRVGFASPHPSHQRRFDTGSETWIVCSGRAPVFVAPDYEDDPDPVRYDTDPPAADGTVDAGMGWAVAIAVRPLDDGRHELVAAATTGFRGPTQRPFADSARLEAEVEATVRAAFDGSAADRRGRHRDEVTALVDAARIDLSGSRSPDATDAERYFNMGRHLLIASSRPGTRASALQGIWSSDMRPAWSGNYTTNINVQMNYWGAEVAGLGDLHDPLFSFTEQVAVSGASVARELYGAEGAAVHHNSDVWGFSDPVAGEPVWSNWATGFPWLVTHLSEHARFTADAAFVAERELPMLRIAVRFLLTMLVPLPDGTGLVVSPSSAPENLFIADGAAFAVTSGATLDQELVLETFARFLEVADVTLDADLVQRVAGVLPRVRRPAAERSGRIEEWAGGRPPHEEGHRHLSHLHGVFPGARLTPTKDPEGFAAARVALTHRLEHGSGYTGWSQAWVLALAARFGDRELAALALHRLAHELSSESLLGLHPHDAWPAKVVFQIDGNLGAIAGIAELIVQSHDDALSILPAIPERWHTGTATGLRARGGVVVDVMWAQSAPQRIDLRSVRPSQRIVIELAESVIPRVIGGEVIGEPVAVGSRRRWRIRADADRVEVHGDPGAS